jgi:spore germination cell wall hydrolase CwlJ-like protein
LARPLLRGLFRFAVLALVASGLSACLSFGNFSLLSPQECLARVMYFESNRSSEEGMLAVGTVVMNRVEHPDFPNTICGVIGQPNQFADGVLIRPMNEKGPSALAAWTATRILNGERHPGVRGAKYFHTAGLRFSYGNMHYVLEAGGLEFYIKSRNRPAWL